MPGVTRPIESRLQRVLSAPATWLALLVGVSAALRSAIVLWLPSPWILPDEVVYSELAKSIANGHRPAVRGIPVFGWGEIYPTLVAPAWALFEDPLHAYHAALAINALVMSLAAVPAYLLARLFVSRRASFLVAVMTVLVPSMAYTGVVMTENAFYPVFLLAVLFVTRAVQRPTVGNQALALLGLAGVAFTRIQGVALVGAYVAAVGVYALIGSVSGDRLAYVRRFVPTAAVLVPVAVAPLILSTMRGGGPFGWAGARSGTFDEFHPHELPKWFVYLLADLLLYVAIAPAAATAVIIGRGLFRPAAEPVRLFAATMLPVALAMLVSVSIVSASLDVDGTENLNERYVFYVVPLAFVGLALWIRERLPRPRPWSWIVVVSCCLLVALLPIDRLEYNASFQSVALVPWILLSLSGTWLSVLAGCFALLCGVVWIRCRTDKTGYLWLLAAGAMAVVGALTVRSNVISATNSSNAYYGHTATWVDDVVPQGEQVAVVWGESPAPTATPMRVYFWLMVTEFFNDSVGDVYRFGPATYYEKFLPTVPVRLGRGMEIVDEAGRSVPARYALVSCQTKVDGDVLATSHQGLLTVVKVDPPLRLAAPHRCPRPPA